MDARWWRSVVAVRRMHRGTENFRHTTTIPYDAIYTNGYIDTSINVWNEHHKDYRSCMLLNNNALTILSDQE